MSESENNTLVSVTDHRITKPRPVWPSHLVVTPSPSELLRFLAASSERAGWSANDVSSFVVIRTHTSDGDPSVDVEMVLTRVEGWNYQAPRAFKQYPITPNSLRKQRMVQQHHAMVYVVTNDRQDGDSLPALFRKASRFVAEQGFDFENVESIRYAAGYDADFNVVPELRITVELAESHV